MGLWEKYGSMGVNSTFKYILCFFFFFFSPPQSSAWLLTCPSPGRLWRTPWFGKMKTEWLLVSESHENSWSHYILLVHSCFPWHPQREEVREKGGSEHPKKMWWKPLNTIHFFPPWPTKSFTLTRWKKETLPFLPSFLEHFTVRSWPKPCNSVSLSLF